MEQGYTRQHGARATSSTQQHQMSSFTNTAKLPIETVKRLIAAVARRPNLWLRINNSGQKRCDITPLWYEVSQDVNLPADICRIKWGHLRDNFRKVFIRNTLTNETPTTWRFYNDMRFMEKAVSENIMRQNRFTRKANFWQDSQQLDQLGALNAKLLHPGAVVPICQLGGDSFDRELHTPSFSDISGFFDDSPTTPPPNKRIKFELQDDFHYKHEANRIKFADVMSGDYTQPVPDNDELDDDDFDEDAATDAETDVDKITDDTNKNANSDVFTIEVLDDDEDNKSNINKELYDKDSGRNNLPFKSITVHAATNTESNYDQTHEQDTDRMFLLSLLPYLQKVDEQRKLRVRQKLQNVLIDEFG